MSFYKAGLAETPRTVVGTTERDAEHPWRMFGILALCGVVVFGVVPAMAAKGNPNLGWRAALGMPRKGQVPTARQLTGHQRDASEGWRYKL